MLGIDPSHTMGCGDEENDLDLITRTAFGVAMGNALPHVKAEADYIAPTNDEDGVADAIRMFSKSIDTHHVQGRFDKSKKMG